MTIALAAQLTLLALIDSTSIGTLLIPVWLLLRREVRHLAPRILLYLAVLAGFYAVVGVLLLSGVGWASGLGAAHALLASPLAQWAMAGAGALMLAYALLRTPRRDPVAVPRLAGTAGGPAEEKLPEVAPGAGTAEEGRWRTRITRAVASPGGVVLLALVAGLLELPTMVPYLAAIGVLTQSTLEFPARLALLALYCLLMLLPAVLLLGVRLVLGERAAGLLRRLAARVAKYSSEALLWGIGIVGFLLLRGGLTALGPAVAWNPFG